MSSNPTAREREDVAFYAELHTSNMHKVNGIFKPIRPESDLLSSLSEEDQKRFRHGRDITLLGSWSINGVPVTIDDIRKQYA
jgi:hypothetical protein